MLEISRAIFDEIKSHAEASYPEECCGLLLGHLYGDRKAVLEMRRAANLNRERANDRYLMDPKDQLAAEKHARQASLEILGYYHSHPDHPAKASSTDDELSWEKVTYLIVSVKEGKLAHMAAFMKPNVNSSLGPEALAIHP
jgi:proteasome lid subunit RPN8/RPN11